MPEFEKVEFEFPDEKEAREAKEAEVKAEAKPEDEDEGFEIVDDTPLKGKSTEENVEPASEEEIEQVNSARVIKRIQQLNQIGRAHV